VFRDAVHLVDRVALYRCICRYLQAAAERDERPIASAASGAGRMSDERQGSTWAAWRERKEKTNLGCLAERTMMVCMQAGKPPVPRLRYPSWRLFFSPSSPSDAGLCARGRHCRRLAIYWLRFDPCMSMNRAGWAYMTSLPATVSPLLLPPPYAKSPWTLTTHG
jgi:hypothetical protein